MQNYFETPLSYLKYFIQISSSLILNLPIFTIPVIISVEFLLVVISAISLVIDIFILKKFFSIKNENEQKIDKISNTAKFVKNIFPPLTPEALKNILPLSSFADFCEKNPDKALMIYNHLFINKSQLLINKVIEICSSENFWKNSLSWGELILIVPVFILTFTSDLFNTFIFFPSLFLFSLGIYLSLATSRLWSQILTMPWGIYQKIYPQKQETPQDPKVHNEVILSRNILESETTQNIKFGYDIRHVDELPTTNLNRGSIYFCVPTRTYIYLSQDNQINSGSIPDVINRATAS